MQKYALLLLIIGCIAMGCTTTKWTVTDEYALDESTPPEILSESKELIIDEYPTIENPILRLSAYNIVEKEYSERVKIERTVQRYRPRWGFALITLTGASFALLSANTGAILPSASGGQELALNIAGGILGFFAVTNLKESGDPIYTGETKLLRRSGYQVQIDTTSIDSNLEELRTGVQITLNDLELFNRDVVELDVNSIELNLASLENEIDGSYSSDNEILITTRIGENEKSYTIAINTFLSSYFELTDDIVQVRSSPMISSDNILTELVEGSALLHVEDESTEQWVKIEYNSVEGYVPRSSGFFDWRSPTGASPGVIVELAEIPFGNIDVENSLPILKSGNSADRAFIISNKEGNQAGSRQYLMRSQQLFRHYMRTSLQMRNDQIVRLDDQRSGDWLNQIETCSTEGGTLTAYISGFATVDESVNGDIFMSHIDEDGDIESTSLSEIFNRLGSCGQDQLFLFIDLNYIDSGSGNRFYRTQNGNSGIQQIVANRLLSDAPNSIVIFGNRIGQLSSQFSGGVDDDKRHSILMYYWAEALKQRKTRMNTFIRHLENNVDYTSRRLHDRPQEIQAFGNYVLDIAQ